MRQELLHWLDRFEAAATPANGYRWSHRHHGHNHSHHIVFSSMVHGNEVGTMPGLVLFLEALKTGEIHPGGPITLLLGNPEAALQDKRFLDFDLNRAWAFCYTDGHEHKRARELRPLLDKADILFDFHQTILASESAFWIFPWSREFGQWARALQSTTVGLTRAPGQSFAGPSRMCIDEYVRSRGRPAVCLELGQRGFDPSQAENVFKTMKAAVAIVDAIQAGITTLESEALQKPEVHWFTTIHQEEWGKPSRQLRPGLKNWTPVSQGEDLAAPGSPPLLVPESGVLLFPKYPDGSTKPHHIYNLAKETPNPNLVFNTTRQTE